MEKMTVHPHYEHIYHPAFVHNHPKQIQGQTVLEQKTFDNVINYDVLYSADFRLLSIELSLNMCMYTQWEKENKPKKFRKLIDANTLKDAWKAFLEFEKDELDKTLAPFKAFKTEMYAKQEAQREEDRKKYDVQCKEAAKNHPIKVGDSMMDLSKKVTYIVEEVQQHGAYFSYQLKGRVGLVAQGQVVKSKLTQRGVERKSGFLHLGKVEPANKGK